MMIFRLLPGIVTLIFLAGCVSPPAPPTPSGSIRWPDFKIAAFSDLHVYAPELGTSGPAWEKQDSEAYELFQDSPEIIQTAVARIGAEKPNFVILSGDLTKDGERASHELMVKLLRPLEKRNTSVAGSTISDQYRCAALTV